MFRKKAVLFLILLTIVAGLLAACGDTPTSTPAPVATSTTVAATTVAPTTSAPTTAVRVTTAPATTPAATAARATTVVSSTPNKALPFGVEYVKGHYDLEAPAGLKEKLTKDFSALIGEAEVNIYATKSDSFFTDTFHRTSLTKAGWTENTAAFKAAGSEKLLGGSSTMQAHTKDGKQIGVFLLDDFSNLSTMQKLGFKNVQSYHTVVIYISGEATSIK